jgi:hypothetical protein
MRDAEQLLRRWRRPLVIGMGGGGDVVGALATAELMRLYDDAEPVVGGLTWERRPVDPVAGPRRVEEIVDAQPLAASVLLAGPDTRVRDREVRFAESHMARFLQQQTVLVDINHGVDAIVEGLSSAVKALGCDAVLFIDVGGDVLAQGHESGLRSPLCDAMMLAAAARLGEADVPVLCGIFGIGCDAELSPSEVLALLAKLAAEGGVCGARGLTGEVAARLEAAIEFVPTEASAQAVRSFRGAAGVVPIRGGARDVELTLLASVTFYLDVDVMLRTTGRLARAVADARSVGEASAALNALGVKTELDLESRPA